MEFAEDMKSKADHKQLLNDLADLLNVLARIFRENPTLMS